MCGIVHDTTTMDRVTNGVITWTVTPAGGGAPVTVSAALTNLNGQFSYRVRIPFESLVGSTTLSAGALRANTAATAYDRALVYINSTNIAIFAVPALTTFTFKSADRGIVERIDLITTLPSNVPSGGQVGFVDSDGDGMSDADELRAGTNPYDPKEYLHFTSITAVPGAGVQLKWTSAASRTYQLLRSTSLRMSAQECQAVALGLPASPPQNSFLDTNAVGSGPYFYRLNVN